MGEKGAGGARDDDLGNCRHYEFSRREPSFNLFDDEYGH